MSAFVSCHIITVVQVSVVRKSSSTHSVSLYVTDDVAKLQFLTFNNLHNVLYVITCICNNIHNSYFSGDNSIVRKSQSADSVS